jgi:Fe-S oxidoreductase
MGQEEKGPRVNRNRPQETPETGVEVAAVACPFCASLITNGVKDAGAAPMSVLQIAVQAHVQACARDVACRPAWDDDLSETIRATDGGFDCI